MNRCFIGAMLAQDDAERVARIARKQYEFGEFEFSRDLQRTANMWANRARQLYNYGLESEDT
jgi:hypothetical protein